MQGQDSLYVEIDQIIIHGQHDLFPQLFKHKLIRLFCLLMDTSNNKNKSTHLLDQQFVYTFVTIESTSWSAFVFAHTPKILLLSTKGASTCVYKCKGSNIQIDHGDNRAIFVGALIFASVISDLGVFYWGSTGENFIYTNAT